MGKRAAIYTRLSSHIGDTKNPWASLDRQLQACRELAKRMGFEVVTEIREVKSGAKAREGYNTILSMATAGEVDAILACHFDRLTRDERLGSFEETKADLRRVGCELYTYDQGQIPLDGSATSELITDTQASAAKHYRLLFMEKSAAGKLGKGRAGGYNGHPVPYGYESFYHPQTGKLAFNINEPQAEAVRRIYAEFLAGTKLHSIAQGLNRDGIPAPKAGHWYYTTVSNILRNPNYAGLAQFRRTVSKDACEVVPSREFPAIIDRETWERTQQMHGIKALRGGGPRGGHAPHPLSGLLRCDGCGRGMVLDRRGHGYYRCANNMTTRRAPCPAPGLLRKDHAEATVLDFLKRRLPAYISTPHAEKATGRQRNAPKSNAERLTKRIVQMEAKIATLMDWELEGRYPLAVIETKRAEFTADLEALRVELRSVQGEAAQEALGEQARAQMVTMAEAVRRLTLDAPELRDFFDGAVATVQIVNEAPARRPQKLRVVRLMLTNGITLLDGD